MGYQDKISTSKTGRTFEFLKTGAKVGGNYLKHYAKKTFNKDLSNEELHNENAEEIYDSLCKLKGSALKVAQMLSMDKGLLPKAYADKFMMAQYQAPPLSGPLVVQTFIKTLGKTPQELFDSFDMNASFAASIGQVHVAYKDGKKLAVKVQYPGVANSIRSDLRMVKPIAVNMLGLSDRDVKKYMSEVEERMIEETDYELELRRSEMMRDNSAHLTGLKFPHYYKELSSSRVITMDFVEGKHLNAFLQTNPSHEICTKAAQHIWNFFDYQMHSLKMIHADPHPGNFLFNDDGSVGIIDFGCMKQIPEAFYYNYFALILPEIRANEQVMDKVMEELEMLYAADTPERKQFLKGIFLQVTDLLSKPFAADTFNFGDDNYLESIYKMGEELSNMKEIKELKDGRGSKHTLYINRTFYGLYNMMHALKATINTKDTGWRHGILKYHGLGDSISDR